MAQERHEPEHQSDSELASELTPTHSEARVRRPGVSVPSDRPERISSRPTPTPFGPPRPSSAHPAVQTARGLGPANTTGSIPPSSIPPGSIPPVPAKAAPAKPKPATSETKPKPTEPDFRAEGDELGPLPDVTQSLPSIPLAAVLPLRELGAPPEPAGRTLLQVGAFAVILAASVVSVLRYAGVLGVSAPTVAAKAPSSAIAMAVEPAAPPAPRASAPAQLARAASIMPTPAAPVPVPAAPAADSASATQDPVTAEVERIVAALADDTRPPAGRADALVGEADRALGRGEERLAETLLGRALKIDEKHPRAAYTLARVRLIQNNLEGAEGWVLVALRERPRVAEYHSLYADILARQGHGSHARRERHKARNLAR